MQLANIIRITCYVVAMITHLVVRNSVQSSDQLVIWVEEVVVVIGLGPGAEKVGQVVGLGHPHANHVQLEGFAVLLGFIELALAYQSVQSEIETTGFRVCDVITKRPIIL